MDMVKKIPILLIPIFLTFSFSHAYQTSLGTVTVYFQYPGQYDYFSGRCQGGFSGVEYVSPNEYINYIDWSAAAMGLTTHAVGELLSEKACSALSPLCGNAIIICYAGCKAGTAIVLWTHSYAEAKAIIENAACAYVRNKYPNARIMGVGR